MRNFLAGLVVSSALILAGCIASGQSSSSVEGLRCEYLTNPLGIDVAKPRLSWTLVAGANGRAQSAYQILVSRSLDSLQKGSGDLWNSGKVSSPQSVFVGYDGRELNSGERCYWKVRIWDGDGRVSAWSAPAKWSMGVLRDSEWHGRFIGQRRPADVKEGTPLPFPWLRKTLELKQKPQRATAYINPLGYFELYINGKRVGEQVLSPAVSDYSKRSYYLTYDISDYLTAGKNSVALWLGRGWYVKGHPGVVHDGPLVRAQFDIALPDGSAIKLGTDDSWKLKPSPITPLGRGTAFGDYGGERYDARLELNQWNSVALDDSNWENAAIFAPTPVPATAQMVEPNRILQTIKAEKIEKSPAGGWLVDMGKNYVGWLDLQLPAATPAGANIKIEFADWTPSNNRYATFNQRDEYITRAGAGQVIRSRFNYHGFRYAHVTGLDRAPALTDVKGSFIRTAYSKASEFESSNELLNRIYQTTTWTYENLTLGGYVVDCPTRERLGYGGDAGTSIEAGMFNFDAGALYSSWAGNWRDAQDPKSGDLPYTAPNYPDQGGGGPMWSGFSVTLPWHIYQQYGDRRALEVNYPMMQKWLAFADSKTVNQIMEPYVSVGIRMPQWNYLGDWVTPRRPGSADVARHPASSRFINNAHYLYTLQLAGKIARTLGKPQDAAMYEQRAATLSRTLHERFYDPATGLYATGEQPYLALALWLGITPPNLRDSVMKTLEQTILVKDQGHINAGMHGVYFLLKLLMEQDRNDLIYTMANQATYPSWGDMLRQGATTIWENWSGGSHIHDTLISVGAWFIQGIGGIQLDEASPGFNHFLIKPSVVGDLKFARASYRSIRGRIVSDWRVQNGVLQLNIVVPPGATATVAVPSAAPEQVTEGGRPAGRSAGVKAVGAQKGRAVFEVGSGRFAFTSKLAN